MIRLDCDEKSLSREETRRSVRLLVPNTRAKGLISLKARVCWICDCLDYRTRVCSTRKRLKTLLPRIRGDDMVDVA